MYDKIIIKGAREHNLKNVSLEIPKGKFVVFTGVSGSGKSSLAFDTIYAEGQRRYVESLSSYARQFLGIMGKPDVDFIEGLSPAISIDQKSVSKNPRSTVGTITEVYDYLRLLFARIGHPFCPNCGREITKLSVDEIAGKIWQQIQEQISEKPVRFRILAPVILAKKGEFEGLFSNLRQKGFAAAYIDGKLINLDELVKLEKNIKHTIDVVVDTFTLVRNDMKNEVFSANSKSRLFESIEASINLADGLVTFLGQGEVRHLYSEKFSCSFCNISLSEIEPRLFSFNSPVGACPTCNGLGYIMKISEDLVLNKALSINEGGILPFANLGVSDTWTARVFKTAFADIGIDLSQPLSKIANNKTQVLLNGNGKVYEVYGTNRFGKLTAIHEQFNGIIGELQRRLAEGGSDFVAWETEKYMREETCQICEGKRLKPEALNVRILNKNIDDIVQTAVDKLLEYIKTLTTNVSPFEKEIALPIIREIEKRLTFLVKVGLAYLTLGRIAGSLSGGESQRIRLASQIGSGLTGVLYVLDEPSIGLHPKDVSALITSLKQLRDIGNTLIVVEHDPETIQACDYVVDFGPKAGKLGGKVIYDGLLTDFKNAKNSLTSDYLYGRRTIAKLEYSARPISYLQIEGCRQFNLKNVSVKFPLSSLIGVTGVSGSGKSTLIVETLYRALKYYLGGVVREKIGDFDDLTGFHYLDSIYLVDQSPIGKTPRSNPATYIGAFDYIRDIFAQTPQARELGFKKGRFSFNVKGGRCEKCQGAGTIKIEMQFLPDVYVTCDVCSGRRYNSQTLDVLYKGKSIFDVLNMTVQEALDFFKSHPLLFNKLETLSRVGLSYAELGQPAPTLSGGEAQRVKLANELSKKDTGRTIYILDEPTTGLHPYDIDRLLNTLHTLVDRGNTVIVIEHNLDVIKNCQYIIDLGPEGGNSGGHLVFEGEIGDFYQDKKSATAQFLRQHLK